MRKDLIDLILFAVVTAGATIFAARRWRAPASDSIYNTLVGQIVKGGTGRRWGRASWPLIGAGWLAVIAVLVARPIALWVVGLMGVAAVLAATTILLHWPGALLPPALRKTP